MVVDGIKSRIVKTENNLVRYLIWPKEMNCVIFGLLSIFAEFWENFKEYFFMKYDWETLFTEVSIKFCSLILMIAITDWHFMVFKYIWFSLCYSLLKTWSHNTETGPSMSKYLIHFFYPINKTNKIISSVTELVKEEKA